jgi:hypothetical protein
MRMAHGQVRHATNSERRTQNGVSNNLTVLVLRIPYRNLGLQCWSCHTVRHGPDGGRHNCANDGRRCLQGLGVARTMDEQYRVCAL